MFIDAVTRAQHSAHGRWIVAPASSFEAAGLHDAASLGELKSGAPQSLFCEDESEACAEEGDGSVVALAKERSQSLVIEVAVPKKKFGLAQKMLGEEPKHVRERRVRDLVG